MISAGTCAKKENVRAALFLFLIFSCLLRISLQAASPLDTTEFEDVEKRTIRLDREDRNLALCMAQQPRLGCGRDGSGGSPLALLAGDLLRLVVSLIPATTLRLGADITQVSLEP